MSASATASRVSGDAQQGRHRVDWQRQPTSPVTATTGPRVKPPLRETVIFIPQIVGRSSVRAVPEEITLRPVTSHSPSQTRATICLQRWFHPYPHRLREKLLHLHAVLVARLRGLEPSPVPPAPTPRPHTEQLDFFEKKIRPVLADNHYKVPLWKNPKSERRLVRPVHT